MQPNQKIEIQLVDEQGRNVRLANVLPTITFFDKGHRYYVFDLRPTGPDGRTVADFSELDTRRSEAALTSLMDYNVPLTALDGTVQVSVSSESELRQQLVAMEKWNHWTRPAWVLRWPANGCLAPVQPKRVELNGPVTHVEITVSLPTYGPEWSQGGAADL